MSAVLGTTGDHGDFGGSLFHGQCHVEMTDDTEEEARSYGLGSKVGAGEATVPRSQEIWLVVHEWASLGVQRLFPIRQTTTCRDTNTP